MTFRPWRAAWQDALYGPGGFYLRPEGPAGHFRTAAHAAGPELAAALARLAPQHGCTAIVDVGAGRGELLTALAGLGSRLRLHGVDVVPRPARLPAVIGWSAGLAAVPEDALADALVVGWELLDVVPCTVLEVDSAGALREVLVETTTGREQLGEPAGPADLNWCQRWWPLDAADEGDRIEVGAARDEFWTLLVATSFTAGARAMLAVDYGHLRPARPAAGSLPGFRHGRAMPPRPDGTMDITAHVAMDSIAAGAGVQGGWAPSLTSQAESLRALGVRSAELLDAGGLGGFDWLFQPLR